QPSRGQKVEDDTVAIEEGVVLSPSVQESPAPDVDNLGVFITHDGTGGYQCRKQFRNGPSALDPRALAEVTYSDRRLDLEQRPDDAPDCDAVESRHLAGHSWSRAIGALGADEDGRVVHHHERPAGAVEVADSQFLAGLAKWAVGVVGHQEYGVGGHSLDTGEHSNHFGGRGGGPALHGNIQQSGGFARALETDSRIRPTLWCRCEVSGPRGRQEPSEARQCLR